MDANSETTTSGKKGAGALIAVVLFVVLCGGGLTTAGVAGLVWWQYGRVTDGADSAGLLTVLNERDAEVAITCTSDIDPSDATTVAIPAGGTATASVPPRPSTCVGTLTADGTEVLRWTANDPPSADEEWTVTLPAPPSTPEPEPVVTAEVPVEGAVPADGAVAADGTTPPDGADAGATTTASTTPATTASTTSSSASSTKTASKSATPAKSTSSTSTTSTSSTSKARPTEPEAPPEDDEKDLPPAGSASDMTLVKIELRKASKLKGAKFTIDGSTVPAPGQKAISTGIHTFKVSKEDVINLECRLVASGKDIVIVIDPDAPKCP